MKILKTVKNPKKNQNSPIFFYNFGKNAQNFLKNNYEKLLFFSYSCLGLRRFIKKRGNYWG